MRISWLGIALSFIYLVGAIYVVQDELRHTYGGWINLRGLGVTLATLPSQVTFGVLFEAAGVSKVNYSEPGLHGYAQLLFHVAVTVAVVYFLGYGVEWAFRRWLVGPVFK